MRKLFLDFLDYVQTGRRLPHCAVCDSRYNDAKPFIEGATGALVCAACIQRFTATEGVDLNLYLATHRLIQQTDDGNPYRPPTIHSGTVQCLLCDQQTSSHVNSRGKLTAAVCVDCLEHSSNLINEHIIG
jgi:hypothetical protein